MTESLERWDEEGDGRGLGEREREGSPSEMVSIKLHSAMTISSWTISSYERRSITKDLGKSCTKSNAKKWKTTSAQEITAEVRTMALRNENELLSSEAASYSHCSRGKKLRKQRIRAARDLIIVQTSRRR